MASDAVTQGTLISLPHRPSGRGPLEHQFTAFFVDQKQRGGSEVMTWAAVSTIIPATASG
jgi:hypothetical protein